jgi:hypothetical protein
MKFNIQYMQVVAFSKEVIVHIEKIIISIIFINNVYRQKFLSEEIRNKILLENPKSTFRL